MCKICNGEFKSELNEAEEEFYWLDAVEVNGVVRSLPFLLSWSVG